MKHQKKIIRWFFSDPHKEHKIELNIWPHSGKRHILIDDSLVFHQNFMLLRRDKIYSYLIGPVKIEIEINDLLPNTDDERNDKYIYDCFVDGISLNSGSSKKSSEDKSKLIFQLEKKEWEKVYSQGLRNYLLKNLGKNIQFLAFAALICILTICFYYKEFSLFFSSWYFIVMMIIAILVSQLISNIIEWKTNCKKYSSKAMKE